MSKQLNLLMREVKPDDVVNGRKVTASQAEKYNSFYKRTFTAGDIDELLEMGGGESLNNFKEASKKIVKDHLYYEAMFPAHKPTFKGRDGKIRESKFSGRLGEVIYTMLPADQRTEIRTIKRKNYSYQVGAVKKGAHVKYNEKTYLGGMFLPKSFFN